MKLLAILLCLAALPTAAQVDTSVAQSDQGLLRNSLQPVRIDTQDSPRRYVLRAIHFVGLRRTKPRIVQREMALREGDVLAADSLRFYTERDSLRLQNVSLFTDVTMQFVPAGASAIELYVILKERWYIWPEVGVALADRNFNVWWTEMNADLRRVNFFGAVADRNFRGNLEYLRIGGQAGYTRRATVEYRRPYVDKKQRHGIGASLAYSENAEHYFTTDSNKLRFFRIHRQPVLREGLVGLLYTFRPGYASRHAAELRYRDFRIMEGLAQENPDFFDPGRTRLRFLEAIYRYDFNGVDNWNYPLYGRKIILTATARRGLEGMRWQGFVHVEAAAFQKVSRRWFTSQVFRGRVSVPERVPYFLRGAMGGGSEYVRGYEYYVIDGSQYAIARGNLKFQAVNKTLRGIPLRFLPTVPIAVYPKVFADVGWARNVLPGNSFLNNRALYGFGLGVDVITAYSFKARLEVSWNGQGERGLFFHQDAE